MKNLHYFIFTLFFSFSAIGQTKNVNNYKYIIVPESFDFLKEKDQYQTSSLLKFLLKKNGYQVFFTTDKLPEELKKDRCNALEANLIKERSLLRTKLSIQLKDCFDKVMYTSKVGSTSVKDFNKAYQTAIRNAHASMNDLQYIPLKNESVKKEEFVKDSIVVSRENIPFKTKNTKNISVLYAQPKDFGFQLVNSEPKVIYLILKSNLKDVFILKDKNGLLYKKEQIWVAEFYENNMLVQQEYQIKF